MVSGTRGCDVFGCSSKTPLVKCFEWPKDKRRREIWEKFCKNPELKKLRRHICAKHFELKHFVDGSRSKTLLVASNSIPTLEPPGSTLITLDDYNVTVGKSSGIILLEKLKKHTCAKHFDLKYFADGNRSLNLLHATKPIPTLEPPSSTLVILSENCDEADLSQGNDDSDEEDVSCDVDPSDVAPSSPLPSTYFSKTAPRLSSSVFPSPPSCVYSYHYL